MMVTAEPSKKTGTGVVAVVPLDGRGDVGIVEGLLEDVLEQVAGGDHLNVPFLNRFKTRMR